MNNGKLNAFGKMGRLITKRKFTIIGVWILLLAIILPVVLTASGVTSMTMNSSSDSASESGKADNIITAHFQKSVSNDSLLLIISTHDASSIGTQQFLDELITKLNSDTNITGVENITSVYSLLVPVLNQTNQAVYFAYNGGNLTYNLLYSVPTIYSNVWYAAYNTTLNDQLIPGLNQTNQAVNAIIPNANQTYNLLYSVPTAYSTIFATAYNTTRDSTLAPGINQTNQGVYTTIQNANLTYNLLYSTPAIYLNVWSQTYNATSDINQANFMANRTTAETLFTVDPVAYAQYTSGLLQAFNSYWTTSFSDPSTITWTPMDRATYASNQTNQLYINTYLSGDATSQAFTNAVINAFTLQDYLTNNQTQNNAELTTFSIQFVTTASTGQSSNEFVTAAYNLGPIPTLTQLKSLAENIIQHPTTYNMGTDFISTFNQVAYNQTANILNAADPTAYAQYTGPLLSSFNTTWCLSFQNTTLQTYTVTQRASLVANITNRQYINVAFASNASMQAFGNALLNSFTLENYLTNTQAQNNQQLIDFAINYIATQGNTPTAFVRAAYNLGSSPSSNSLSSLGNQVIWYPTTYNMTTDFITTFNKVSFDQTAKILRDADASAYQNYTSHMLTYFNALWASKVPSSPSGTSWINSTASSAADVANLKFIDNYLNDTKDFATQIAQTFTLQDFLRGNSTSTNQKLYNLTITYVANQSGLSKELMKAVYGLGENATKSSLQALSSSIVANSDAYNLGEALNTALTSFVSPLKDVTLVSISFTEKSDNNLLAIRSDVKELLNSNPDGVSSVQVTGSDAISYDFQESTYSDLELILPVTIILLVAATALFFRSIVTPVITLGTIGVGLGVSQIFPFLVGTYINSVDYTVNTVLLTVLIGVGTDYSIFIIARHREERINDLPIFEAIKKSITWAGESIVTSGATVIISFLALSTTSMVMLQTMGLVVGLGVIVTLLASLTFAPALIAILGDKIFWPNSGERFQRYAKGILEKNKRKGGYFARSGSFSVKHGKVIVLLAILVTVPTFYIYSTTTPTYNLIGSASGSIESMAGMNTLTNSFGGGRMLPTYAVVTFSEPIIYSNGSFNTAEMSMVNSISSYIVNHEGVEKVTGPTMPFGTIVDYQTITNESDSTTYSSILSNIGNDNQSVLISVQFVDDPYTSQAMDYAKDIRAILHSNYDSATNLTGVYIGGTTGSILDMRTSFENEFNSILPIVALGVGIVLFFVLGSLILPVFAILSVLMSIVWTLAVTILVFQSAFGYGLLFITPLILFVLLLGLGMDYNIFILTRIREEAGKGQSQNEAIIHAIQQTGGIITAAAIILAGSLGALLLSSNMMLREMGFAFAFSILIDAIVVRTYLVPAVMATFGKWNWYNPIKRLRRVKDQDTKEKAFQNVSAETKED
jgi:putative drug exporter of the RND superfamily